MTRTIYDFDVVSGPVEPRPAPKPPKPETARPTPPSPSGK